MTKKKKLIIYGTTDFAEYVFYYFSKDINYEVIAFTVEDKFKITNEFKNLPVLSFDNIENIIAIKDYFIFIAIGPTKMNKIRQMYFDLAKQKGFKFANYISKNAIVNSDIGENNFIGDFAVINHNVSFGNNNIVYEHVIFCIGSKIKNNSYFAPKAIVGTNSVINNNVIIGMGSIIKTDINIETETLIGASCYITNDTKHKSVYAEKSSSFIGLISDKVII